MKLHEILNKPVKYYWAEQKDHRWEGYFKIDNFLYEFEARKDLEPDKRDLDPGEWEVYIYQEREGDKRVSKDTITGTRNEFVVFATVAKMFDDFMKKVKPQLLTFFSSDDEKSRHKLYSRFVKKAAQKYKYDYKVGSNYYELIKKGK